MDSGSEPTVADCAKVFPNHKIERSPAQDQGIKYKGADGSIIPNEGQVHVVHRDEGGQAYKFTFQNAKVHTQILSIRQWVQRDCVAVFHKLGGYVWYPDGRVLKFVCRGGVFFMLLNIDDPLTPDFARQGPEP